MEPLICCKIGLMRVVKRATSLFSTFCSNVAKQVSRFPVPELQPAKTAVCTECPRLSEHIARSQPQKKGKTSIAATSEKRRPFQQARLNRLKFVPLIKIYTENLNSVSCNSLPMPQTLRLLTPLKLLAFELLEFYSQVDSYFINSYPHYGRFVAVFQSIRTQLSKNNTTR